MKKTFFVSVALLLCASTGTYAATNAETGSKMSPYTKFFLHLNEKGVIDQKGMTVVPVTSPETSIIPLGMEKTAKPQKRLVTKIATINGVPMVESFIQLAEGGSVADIEEAGAIVTSEIGDILIARMPVDAIEHIASLQSVAYVEISQPLRLLNNHTREAVNMDIVHQGGGTLPSAYTGKGVIVGVIDSGIDYNHINFKDENGDSRVVRAFVADNYFGSGETYDDPDEIARLTTDTDQTTHGSHVAGIAAGSYTENGLQGMAPDADLYLSGIGDNITETAMAEQAESIVSYAKEAGQPVVINLSVGGNNGPHAGTSLSTKVFDQLSGEGVIFALASGNEGTYDLYLNKQFENPSGDSQVQTVMLGESYYGYTYQYYGIVDGYTNDKVSLKLQLIDTTTKQVLYESEEITDDWELYGSDFANDIKAYYSYNTYSSYLAISFDYDAEVEKYVTTFEIVLESTNLNRSGRYKLGFVMKGEQGDELHMWSGTGIEFSDGEMADYTGGSPVGSYSELVTGSEVISVGASVANRTWSVPGQSGTYSYNDDEEIGKMASFSSYGVDMNGRWHPTIVAPGYAVSSSFNRYNYGIDYSTSSYTITSQISTNGNTYYWGVNSGTSMACPAVAGIIATWLQYDPTLTPERLKDIFAATSYKPQEDDETKALQWGPNGIIDAYAGLTYMGATGVNDVTKAQDMVLVYPNPTEGQFKVFAQGEDEVNISIYNAGGTLMFSRDYATIDGNIDIDLQGELQPGFYMLQVRGDRQNYSTKLIIK